MRWKVEWELLSYSLGPKAFLEKWEGAVLRTVAGLKKSYSLIFFHPAATLGTRDLICLLWHLPPSLTFLIRSDLNTKPGGLVPRNGAVEGAGPGMLPLSPVAFTGFQGKPRCMCVLHEPPPPGAGQHILHPTHHVQCLRLSSPVSVPPG